MLAPALVVGLWMVSVVVNGADPSASPDDGDGDDLPDRWQYQAVPAGDLLRLAAAAGLQRHFVQLDARRRWAGGRLTLAVSCLVQSQAAGGDDDDDSSSRRHDQIRAALLEAVVERISDHLPEPGSRLGLRYAIGDLDRAGLLTLSVDCVRHDDDDGGGGGGGGQAYRLRWSRRPAAALAWAVLPRPAAPVGADFVAEFAGLLWRDWRLRADLAPFRDEFRAPIRQLLRRVGAALARPALAFGDCFAFLLENVPALHGVADGVVAERDERGRIEIRPVLPPCRAWREMPAEVQHAVHAYLGGLRRHQRATFNRTFAELVAAQLDGIRARSRVEDVVEQMLGTGPDAPGPVPASSGLRRALAWLLKGCRLAWSLVGYALSRPTVLGLAVNVLHGAAVGADPTPPPPRPESPTLAGIFHSWSSPPPVPAIADAIVDRLREMIDTTDWCSLAMHYLVHCELIPDRFVPEGAAESCRFEAAGDD